MNRERDEDEDEESTGLEEIGTGLEYRTTGL